MMTPQEDGPYLWYRLLTLYQCPFGQSRALSPGEYAADTTMPEMGSFAMGVCHVSSKESATCLGGGKVLPQPGRRAQHEACSPKCACLTITYV